MVSMRDNMASIARFAAEVAAETLWPTRCAICDMPGAVLCERCAQSLVCADWWRACRRCGSPFGYVQCDACNPVTLGRIGRESFPFRACTSAVVFDDDSGQLVRVYKDQGERRLAAVLATMMVRAVPPEWRFELVTFVPATSAALRSRGFDHAELLAQQVAERVGAACVPCFERPRTRDQRALSGAQRIENLSGRFSPLAGICVASHALLVDDVFTTGATLCAATDALLAAGCDEVRCLTFARV